MADYLDTPECCGVKTEKQINCRGGFYFKGGGSQIDAYKCPVTDQVVTNQRQRKNIEAEHEITVVEPGMFPKRKKEKAPELPTELKPHLQPALDELAQTI